MVPHRKQARTKRRSKRNWARQEIGLGVLRDPELAVLRDPQIGEQAKGWAWGVGYTDAVLSEGQHRCIDRWKRERRRAAAPYTIQTWLALDERNV